MFVQAYVKAGVHKIKVGNRELFWVKMIDVQKGLGLKNMPDLDKKEICGFLKQENPQKNKRKNI